MPLDIVTIGDPTVDTVVKIHDAHVALRVDPRRAELCIDYADKIPVDELHRSPAGNCVNAALAAAAVGMRAGLYGVTGDDSDGRWIREELDAAGVDTSLLASDHRHSTNASMALIFRGERTLFVWHQPRRYHLPPLPEAAWVYATSVGPAGAAVTALHHALVRQARRGGFNLAFSPGTHQLRMGRAELAPMLCASGLLLLNRQEAEELTGCTRVDTKDLLRALAELGPHTIVMTDGVRGSYGYDGERFLRSGILETPVVDRTGAGDSYGATLVAALRLGLDLSTAMAWATVQAAFVVGAPGQKRGLVGRPRIETVVRRHPALVAKPF